MGRDKAMEQSSVAHVIDSENVIGVEVYTSDSDRDVPGLNWTLSEVSEQALRDIDANLRAADQLSGRILVGTL